MWNRAPASAGWPVGHGRLSTWLSHWQWGQYTERCDTITVNMEHVQNVILAVFSALIASNKGEETAEVREEKVQQGGEARNEYTSSEALRQSSPTRMCSPVNFGLLAGCMMCDVSTIWLGTHNPWANLNWQHCCSHPCKPSLSTPIQTIQHPHRIGPTKPIFTFPVIVAFKRPFIHTYYYQSTPL